MSKFKIGDDVILNNDTLTHVEGSSGIVRKLCRNSAGEYSGYVRVDFESDVGRHNATSVVCQDFLELIKRASVENKTETLSALDKQVSGDHYKSCGIQPIEYIHANGLSYLEGNVIKYTTRHSKKNGRQDIEKAIHYLELILEMEYKDK